MKKHLTLFLAGLFLLTLAGQISAETPSADFPQFRITSADNASQDVGDAMRELYWHHYAGATPKSTFWDSWLLVPGTWPDTEQGKSFREQWKSVLLTRKIDVDGYVSSHQHHGFGHAEGWPFPLHSQGGAGWVFSRIHAVFYDEIYGIHFLANTNGFAFQGLKEIGIDEPSGLKLQFENSDAILTASPCAFSAEIIPLVRLDWDINGFDTKAEATLQWTTEQEPEFSADKQIAIPLPTGGEKVFTHLFANKHPKWQGTITRLQIVFKNTGSSEDRAVNLRSLIATFDSRHVVNQPMFLRGCYDYFAWTADVDFLRKNMQRMRHAFDYALNEFEVEKHACVSVPWVGHDGRPAFTRDANGNRTAHHGRGIGGNYWDILPFGGRECLATIYYYDAILRMASLEEAIAAHPEWNVAASEQKFPNHRDPKWLRSLAKRMKDTNDKFWNEETGRFVAAIDADGNRHDFGYTFVNNEAIYYGYANAKQAASIESWLTGERIVDGDTSQGADIYHWRFGPRATTKRNLDYYFWAWSAAETIPFGDQVQDGGAVLGFGFHDMMSKVQTIGSDKTLKYVEENAKWFREVQAEGGYRNYYAPEKKRGTMQGANIAGGLGLDKEFFESVMYPQVMLFGFAGFEPRFDGFAIEPKMPQKWETLSIDRIRWQDQQITLTLTQDSIELTTNGPEREIALRLPKGKWTADDKTFTFDNTAQTWKTTPGKTVKFVKQ